MTNATPGDNRGGIDRRTVVRAGAHAMWAVPVVSVATAAPAVAQTLANTATLNVSGYNISRSGGAGSGSMLISAVNSRVTNSVSVALTFTQGTKAFAAKPINFAASGWSVSAVTGAGTLADPWSVSFTTATDIPNNGSIPLSFTFAPGGSDNGKSNPASATKAKATAAGCVSGTQGSATVD